ncbi:MAG: hypothetical protein AAFO70_05445 [Pseudomonadota bacterium]
MNARDWLFLFEFGGAFALLVLFCWWQLRSLKKLDEEEEREKGD